MIVLSLLLLLVIVYYQIDTNNSSIIVFILVLLWILYLELVGAFSYQSRAKGPDTPVLSTTTTTNESAQGIHLTSIYESIITCLLF